MSFKLTPRRYETLTEIFLVISAQKIPIARSKNVQNGKASRRAPQSGTEIETLAPITDDGLVAAATLSTTETTTIAKMKITADDHRTGVKIGV
uniref:Uncharacterized protein n=1 Tax=Romanomermis culicivorax TaxID=13658 RepID=A0A915HZ48_ROMCU